jgi:diguanylate cyclase (GGDEF)-like protein
MDTHVSIPIVFLSAESDLRKQLDAMSLGGDDFLTKPIVPWHLVSSVTSRIKRGRTIRALAECDSLTGLLNHTSGKKRFDAEIARAKRDGSPVSFAMLDIDHFKHVNDTYGHPTGDRVLKSLSGLLRQRLRISDSISRYGGEEFVAILPDTSSENAKKIMDAIREDFSAIKQQCEDGREFQCAFSCGISALGVVESATALINAADKALYEAKESGRNRIVIATTESTK